jgi:SAM-dependent methyltransferase
MDALTYIATKYGLNLHARSPIEIPNVGRNDLARLFHELAFQRGVEIGVEQGLFSQVLCQQNPGVQLFCVDPYKAYRGYRDHVNQQKLDGFYAAAQERLAPYRATFVRKFSLVALEDFADGSLDFVYIDGNHDFQHCTNDIAEWSKKVRPGGIIAGHDYVRYRLPNQIQVVQAVNGWTDANEIAPWFLLGTQAKVEGEIRDTARSFFWVHDPKPMVPRGKKAIKQ